MYLQVCRLLNVNVLSGFLFRSVSRQGEVTQKPLEPGAVQARLVMYQRDLEEGSLSSSSLTLQGFRSGAAISMALADVPLDQIMDHVGWKSTKKALHYIKLKEVVNPAGPAAKLADIPIDLGKVCKVMNNLTGFSQAFPE